MKKLLPLLMILLMATSVSAYYLKVDGKYMGCPASQEGCPGYKEFRAERLSRTGPQIIKGDLSQNRLQNRDYSSQCWWQAGEGNVCSTGTTASWEPKRLRTSSLQEVREASDMETEVLKPKVETGPRTIARGKFTRFQWRGESRGLRYRN